MYLYHKHTVLYGINNGSPQRSDEFNRFVYLPYAINDKLRRGPVHGTSDLRDIL